MTQSSNHDTGKALDRYLSRIDVWSMAFGCMVGWGVFAMPGNTFLPVGGPAGSMLSMIIGMLIMLVIGLNISYLMGKSSLTGGVYHYTKEAFGRDHAFLSSWFLCLSYLTIVFLNGTAMFYIIRILFSSGAQTGPHYTIAGNTIYIGEIAISALVLALVGILYLIAKPLLQRLMTILGIILMIGVVITAALCIPHAVSSGALHDFGTRNISPGYAVFSLVTLAPWAFVGFEITSFDTAHFKFPVSDSKKIIILSIIAAAFAYGSMMLVSVASVPDGFSSWQEYIASLDSLSGVDSVPTFYAARSIMGSAGLVIMTLTAGASILTGIIGGYRAATRILATMAEDKILSARFSETSNSILFIMIISITLSLFGRNTLNWFIDLTSLGAIVGFGYISAAAWKRARIEGDRRMMTAGGAGTLISVIFVMVQLIPRLAAMEAMSGEAFLMLALWCLLGFLFYWRTVNSSNLAEYSGISTSGTALFALLIYSALMWLAKLMMSKDSAEEMRSVLVSGGALVLIIIFAGLVIMLYVQNFLRTRHEAIERDRIHAVESSLAKSRFLFNMSHDIRTPMNAIIGYTNLAMQEAPSPEMKDYLRKIDSSSQHLLSLINDILEMSRIESGKIELDYVPVDICSVFDDMRELFAEQMRQKVIYFSVLTSQVKNRYVWCDRKNLNRVLINVISNAYKFTPEGGSVSASVWEIDGGETGYSNYEIRIRDNGIGMSREFADKMFNAFERERTSTVSKVQGTGLGLSITKSIVDLMGGTIEVMTAPGSGTEMVIRLLLRIVEPEDMPAAEEASPDKTDISEADFTGRRILLVEDNLINMEIASMILTQAGFEVETAENGQIAVDMVRESEPGYYDAVLMDIQMPVMDGYEATRAIRALDNRELASVPILAMTANAFKEDEDAAMEAGMQAHIAKPIDIGDMLGKIRSVLS